MGRLYCGLRGPREIAKLFLVNVMSKPLLPRKERLAAILKTPPAGIAYSEHEGGDGEDFRNAACSHGLEGIASKGTDRSDLPAIVASGSKANASTAPSS